MQLPRFATEDQGPPLSILSPHKAECEELKKEVQIQSSWKLSNAKWISLGKLIFDVPLCIAEYKFHIKSWNKTAERISWISLSYTRAVNCKKMGSPVRAYSESTNPVQSDVSEKLIIDIS